MILSRPPTSFRRLGAMTVLLWPMAALSWPMAAQAEVKVNWDVLEELRKGANDPTVVLHYPDGEPRTLPSLRYPDIDSRGDEVILIPPRPAVPPITLIPPRRPTRGAETVRTPDSTQPPPLAMPSEPVDVAPLEATVPVQAAPVPAEPAQRMAEPKTTPAPSAAPVASAPVAPPPVAPSSVTETAPVVSEPAAAPPAKVETAAASEPAAIEPVVSAPLSTNEPPASAPLPANRPAGTTPPRPTVTASLPNPATATDALQSAGIPPAVPGADGVRPDPIRLASLKTHNEPTNARPLASRGVAPTLELAQILFEAESAALPGLAKDDLAALAGELARKARRIELQAFGGSAGDRSTPARRLSLKRALAVRAYLIALGVDSNRIDVHAIGGARDGGPADRVDVVTSAD